ncbi:MAG: energy transducer TonB [Burkholderiales bacterium]|nr:energy transducer TonB [Burkholderiales bacterium]
MRKQVKQERPQATWPVWHLGQATPTPSSPDRTSRHPVPATEAPLPSNAASSAATEEQPLPLPAPVETKVPTTETEASNGSTGDPGGDTLYIPRPELSAPPVPLSPVLVSAPEGPHEVARITGILSLYIDEKGQVHHIVSSGPPMPPEFEEAAKKAFVGLTYRPGMLDGAPVKSRIRVEVVFDNTPIDLPAPNPIK